MSGRGKSRTIQTQLKPCSQASASVPQAPGDEPAPTQMNPEAQSLKLELLSSLKEDIAGNIKKELQDVLGDALSSNKAELQTVKTQLVSDYAATKAKLGKLTATVVDVEEALTGCTDDIAGLKTTLNLSGSHC
ncbi:hypothetical protein ILYODFUR_011146 [Ilyodon furcidens]|uniref:Uncharacterized protein n=1 Tax=Ilyodon furcidens TaxID=33524 RepID=A0ABV0THP9_9TELE